MPERKRNGRLNVRLEENMLILLDELSREMCIAPSTLGAVAIAEYVNSKLSVKRQQERVATLIAEKNAQVAQAALQDPSVLKLLASAEEPDDDQPRLEGV